MISHILLDMDGVIADFVTQALRWHDRLDLTPEDIKEFYMEKFLGLNAEEFWSRLRGEEFWVTMPAYHWTSMLYSLCSKYAPVTISTSPTRDPYCPSGKIKWLQKHVAPGFRNYMIGHQKHLMAHPDVVLIDDSDKNVNVFRECGGKAILFPQPWNMNRDTHFKIAYVEDQLNALRLH